MSPSSMPERDLLARCVAHQPGAWSEFVERYAGLLYHVIEHSARCREMPLSDTRKRELCEEIFAWLRQDDMAVLRQFQWRSHFVTWLTVMARRRIVHRLIESAMAQQLGHVKADLGARQAEPAGAAAPGPNQAPPPVETAELIAPGSAGGGSAGPASEPTDRAAKPPTTFGGS